jgi:hypothetical protein
MEAVCGTSNWSYRCVAQVVLPDPVVQDALIKAIPIPLIFEVMMTRIVPELTIDKHMSALYVIGKDNKGRSPSCVSSDLTSYDEVPFPTCPHSSSNSYP